MAQRCILKTRAQIDGAIREPGYIFILPDGKLGPHRTTRASHEQINQASGLYERIETDPGEDKPLYEVLEDIEPPPPPSLDERIAAKRAELEKIAATGRPLFEELKALERERDGQPTQEPAPAISSAPPAVPKTIPALVGPAPVMSNHAPPPTDKGESGKLDGSF